MTIDTGKELKDFVESCVSSGMYRSNSEVVREGLRMLKEKQEKSELAQLKKLRELIKEGEESGEPIEFNFNKYIKDL